MSKTETDKLIKININNLESNTCNCEGDNDPCIKCSYDDGWNNCLYTLEEKRLLLGLPDNIQLKIDRLKLAEFCLKRARDVDVLEPADHVYQLAKQIFKESYGYDYGTKKP